MDTIFYTDDDHLHRILKTRTDAAASAVVLLPRGWAWLVAEKAKVVPVVSYQPLVSETGMGLQRLNN